MHKPGIIRAAKRSFCKRMRKLSRRNVQQLVEEEAAN